MRALRRHLVPVAFSGLAFAAQPVAAQTPVLSLADLVSEAFGVPAPDALAPVARPVRTHRRPGRLAAVPAGLRAMVDAAAARHGVPSGLAHAIVRIESGYRCGARSRGGARGIMQILPRSARGVGIGGDLFDCATGLEAGMRYLRLAIAAGGSGCVGASLYNAGLAAPHHCTAYGRRAMALVGPGLREARR